MVARQQLSRSRCERNSDTDADPNADCYAITNSNTNADAIALTNGKSFRQE